MKTSTSRTCRWLYRCMSSLLTFQLACSRGIDLIRIEVIPDDVQEIKESVLHLKKRVGSEGIVFTSGGIGPTHDDVTYEAIAAAFGGQ